MVRPQRKANRRRPISRPRAADPPGRVMALLLFSGKRRPDRSRLGIHESRPHRMLSRPCADRCDASGQTRCQGQVSDPRPCPGQRLGWRLLLPRGVRSRRNWKSAWADGGVGVALHARTAPVRSARSVRSAEPNRRPAANRHGHRAASGPAKIPCRTNKRIFMAMRDFKLRRDRDSRSFAYSALPRTCDKPARQWLSSSKRPAYPVRPRSARH